MKILAIGAYPTDMELSCFGTLRKALLQGDSVVVCSVTDGSLGHKSIDKEELRLIRMAEGAKAALSIGATFSTLDIDELHFDPTDEKLQLQLIEIMRSTKPDYILTCDSGDPNPIRRKIAELVHTSLYQATKHQIKSSSEALITEVPVYYVDMGNMREYIPTDYVDISGTFMKKIEALTLHASQVETLSFGGLEILERIEKLAEFRGVESACRYAEAFRYAPHQIALTKRVLP